MTKARSWLSLCSLVFGMACAAMWPQMVPAQTQPTASASPRYTFTMSTQDVNLEGVLRRWAAEHGWRLVCKDMPDVRITGQVTFTKTSWLQAADAALLQAQRAGYKLQATAYRDRVLVISRAD